MLEDHISLDQNGIQILRLRKNSKISNEYTKYANLRVLQDSQEWTTPNQYYQKYPFPCTESQGMFICLRIFVQRFLCCQYTFEVSTELGMYLQCNYLYWCINSTFHSPKMELAKLLYNDINLYLSRQYELLNSKLQDQKEKLPLPKLYKKVAPKAFSFTIAMMTDDVS